MSMDFADLDRTLGELRRWFKERNVTLEDQMTIFFRVTAEIIASGPPKEDEKAFDGLRDLVAAVRKEASKGE